MNTIDVKTSSKQYPVHIGRGLLNNAELIHQYITGKQVMVVTNNCIAPLYLQKLLDQLTPYQCDHIILQDGEQYKTLAQMSQIIDHLVDNLHHRDTTVINLGGGVICDMGGFAAACYQRGVAFIQIPTSLLAQVDASIGGKTAVNHPKSKNFIGAFHQPEAVLIDTDVLQTLPPRQLHAGIAEIIKHGLIRDAQFFDWLTHNIDKLLQLDSDALNQAILRSCQIKAEIVAIDETEQGARALLNLGHTFAHAIESLMNYQGILHGEAVAIGLILAAKLSEQRGWLNDTEVRQLTDLIEKSQLPKQLPNEIDYRALPSTMLLDKKTLNNQLRMILLKAIGQGVIVNDVQEQEINALFQ